MIGLEKKHLIYFISVVFCIAPLWTNSFGQTSDLRYSRVSPPGLSEVSRVEVRVSLEPPMNSTHIIAIADIVKTRLERLGYNVVLPKTKAQEDLVLHVTCDADTTQQKPSSTLSDSESIVREKAVSPPCRLAYAYKGDLIPWIKVDRFIYVEGVSAMDSFGASMGTLEGTHLIRQFLGHYDFPILLAAEWGHVHRLFQVLNKPATPLKQKNLILTLLGEIQDPRAFTVLVDKLRDSKLAKVAARALGCYALRGRPYLLKVLQKRADPQLQTAAAAGLGKIAAATGDSQPTPLFLELVTDPTVDVQVKTALVWALGKAPDFRAYPTLAELEQSLWLDHSNNPQLQRFREAVSWSIREVKQGGHGDDF